MASQKASKGIPDSANNKQKQAQHQAYLNEDRRWHNKLARLARRFAKSGLPKYQRDYESVMARAPIQVRLKYKEQRLAG